MFSRASSVFSENYPNFSKNITENYSTLSNKFNDNYSNLSDKFNANYSTLSSGLTNTRSTITSTFSNGTTYIYSFPASIGNTVYSYASVFEPVNAEENETTISPPNENLADKVISLNHDREKIIYHILDLYSCKPSKECFEFYDDDVIFDDPIIYTTGLQSLKAQFYGMQKFFVKSTTEKYQILENTPNVLRISLNQKYTLPFVSRAVMYNSEIILELRDDKITKHIDRLNGKPSGEEGLLRKGIAKLFTLLVSVPEN